MSDTPPSRAAHTAFIPRCVIPTESGLVASVPLHRGQVVCADAAHGQPRPPGAELRINAPTWLGTDERLYTDDRPLMAKLLASHSVHPSRANCTIDGHVVRMTHEIPPQSPLVLGLCESSILTQDIPAVLAACNTHVCEGFLMEHVPKDSNAVAGHPAGVDGYITIPSMTRVACHAPWCTHAAVIGCGYGEMVALLALSGRTSCIGFEMFEDRKYIARAVTGAAGVFDRTPLFNALSTFTCHWSDEPTLIWTNNYRFNDDPASDIPKDLLGLPHFPADTSALVCMVPFTGEAEVPVCMCGNCYEGFCDHRGLPGCYIVRHRDHVHIPAFCGPHLGFASGNRVMIRSPSTGVRLEPRGAGTGTFDACEYQLFTCTETPPTPHDGIAYEKIVLTAPSDINSDILSQLDFVTQSVVVGGPLLEHSLLFHGIDGEEYGIDVAIVFTAQEPGADPIIFAYRTLARVRDCDMPGVVRINHDVVRSTMQGRSFINQVNLITAHVIRSHFADATTLVLEPDRDIGYHQNYKSHGFLWRLQQALVCSETPSVRVSSTAVAKYRRQIDLCPVRYPSVWIELPEPTGPEGPGSTTASGQGAAHKRRRHAVRA